MYFLNGRLEIMAAPNLRRLFADRKLLKLGTSVFEFNSSGMGQIVGAAGDAVFMRVRTSVQNLTP